MADSTAPVLATARYALTIDGTFLGAFSEVNGASLEIPAAEQWVSTGGGELMILAYPTNVQYGDLVLRAGRGDKAYLYEWIQSIANRDFKNHVRSGEIVEYGTDGTKVIAWDLEDAFPTKWELGEMKAGANTIRIESLTLNITSITLQK